jgi:putative cardiolipin synthase
MLTEAGVEVEVLTNSLAATDVAMVHGGYTPYRVPLLSSGVQIYELQPYVRKASISLLGSRGASLHTKAFTVDEHTGFVGSFNFDPRSASLNTEMGVLFVEPGLVARLREIFRNETSPHMSYRVYLSDSGSLRWDGEDDDRMVTWDHEPEASFMRRLVARVVSWLPIESQL